MRNGHGAVSCNTMSAGYNKNVQYGGDNGKGSCGCLAGFIGVGNVCFKLPVQDPALFSEMADNCKRQNAIPYAPITLVQNAILKGWLEMMVRILWFSTC